MQYGCYFSVGFQCTLNFLYHIVRACFPQVPAFLKGLSRLNAILGRYPESSKSVNKGKKIAIGGSITDTTHASTL